MKIKQLFVMSLSLSLLASACKNTSNSVKDNDSTASNDGANFEVINEKFADLQVLRYQVPGFEELTAQQKELAYYLYEAALCGRDIIYDQKYKHNLAVRKTIEAIYAC